MRSRFGLPGCAWSASTIVAAALVFAPMLRAQHAKMLRLDHVIVGGDSLERMVAEFARRTGVRPVFGGQHPGRGTQNALVRLGERTYLELIAPVHDSAGADVKALHTGFRSFPVIGFALGSDSLELDRARFEARSISVGAINPGARRTPSGAQLSWRSARLPTLGMPWDPFLIQWGAGTAHPSTTAPGGCTIVSLQIRTPSATLARGIAARMQVPPRVQRATTPTLRLTLACPTGRVVF